MRRSIGIATVAALAAAHPYVALGQSSKVPNSPEQSVQAEVIQALEAAGLRDVKIERGTFAVHATDPSGSPVMMVINPDTFGSDTEHEGPDAIGYGHPKIELLGRVFWPLPLPHRGNQSRI
jgi:hypothetical protein